VARARKVEWDSKIKLIATMLSAGAALASILSFVAGRRTAREAAAVAGLGAIEVSRIALSPSADTAYSLGDTVQFTTLAADAHGQALHAAAVHWSVDDPGVASVDSTGLVVAKATGSTVVTVAIGGRAGRARFWVVPRMTGLAIVGDSVIPVAEGTSIELRAVGNDARGNWLVPAAVDWSGGDEEVAQVDSTGTLRAVAPGRTRVMAASAGLVAEREILVRPVPTSMTLTAGGAQRSAVGQRLPAAVAVQVVSRSGRPVSNARVEFDASMAAGSVEPAAATTDSLGIAATRWTLGAVPGRQRLSITAFGIDSALTVVAEADPTPGNTRIAHPSDSLTAEVGTMLPQSVTIQVTDTAGLVLADLPLTWTALNGGSFSQADARTDSLGAAHARWTLGPRAGRQEARVQVGNPRTLPPVVLTADALPGAATAVEVVSGDRQRGVVGSRLAKPLVLRAVDSLGNPVSDVPLRLSSRGGSVDSVVTTGKDGRASARWTMGKSTGTARLVARIAPKGDSAIATAAARAGAPKTIVFASAPSSGTAGRQVPKTIRVVVMDQYGNPVPRAAVRFSVHSGKVSPAQASTDASGQVFLKWTLGTTAGKQSLTATIKSPAVKAYHVITAQAPPVPKSRRRK
jgi:hypothetical protein